MTIAMSCPACGKGGALTIDSRGGPASVRRRRQCPACKHRWTTYEVPAEAYLDLLRTQASVDDFLAQIGRPISPPVT